MPVTPLKSFEDIKKAPIAIVDFGAEWCGPCKFIKPEFKKMAEEFAGKATFIECDIDAHQEISDQFEIQSVPTFIVFKNGSKVDVMTGADATKLRKLIEKAVQ